MRFKGYLTLTSHECEINIDPEGHFGGWNDKCKRCQAVEICFTCGEVGRHGFGGYMVNLVTGRHYVCWKCLHVMRTQYTSCLSVEDVEKRPY